MAAPLLLEIINHVRLKQGGMPNIDVLAWQAFEKTTRDLTRKLEQDPIASERLLRFVTASHGLKNAEIRSALEYIYSHLVNKYQGALGEFLAARELSVWLSERVAREELGIEILLATGADILERSTDRTSTRWLKGADGLLLVGDDDLENLFIAGVVEIKSFSTKLGAISRQLEAHVSRLQHGLRLGSHFYPPERLAPVWWHKKQGWQIGTEEADWRRILRILVSPRSRSIPEYGGQIPSLYHHIALPVSKPTLAATAYELTVRFLEGIGATAYATSSPWPEMTPEEASYNAAKEALYHILLENRDTQARFSRWLEARRNE